MAEAGTPRQSESAVAQNSRQRSASASTPTRSARAAGATSMGVPTRSRIERPGKPLKSDLNVAARQVPSIATGTTRAVGAERRSAASPPALNFPREPSRLRVPSAKITALARSGPSLAPSLSISANWSRSPRLREMKA